MSLPRTKENNYIGDDKFNRSVMIQRFLSSNYDSFGGHIKQLSAVHYTLTKAREFTRQVNGGKGSNVRRNP